ncbi:MAG TPA: Crp/Fnr family transcriptional regulator [Flavisolibacter sp.]
MLPSPLVRFITTVYPMGMEQAQEIAGMFVEREIEKNTLLFPSGKICNEYFFLETGLVRAHTQDLEGNDITTAFYSPGQVVCDLFSFFKRVPSREEFRALTDCRTRVISFEDLQKAFHTLPVFREFGRTILVNAYAQLKLRMLSTLHQTAEERYRVLLLNNPDILQHAPLKSIASYLGVTDTSLSRIRKEVMKKHTS